MSQPWNDESRGGFVPTDHPRKFRNPKKGGASRPRPGLGDRQKDTESHVAPGAASPPPVRKKEGGERSMPIKDQTPPKATNYSSFQIAAHAMRATVGPAEQLVRPNDGPEMKRVLELAVLPPLKVDGQDNPAFKPAYDALRAAIGAANEQDLGKKLNLFAQRTISGVATQAEINAMFGIYTAKNRRWQAHDVLAVRNAVAAIKTSRPALTALLTETFVAQTLEGAQVRNLARQVPNTTYVSYAYGKDALPAYLKILKDNGLTDAAAELERHIGESNLRAALAQQRAQERRKEANKLAAANATPPAAAAIAETAATTTPLPPEEPLVKPKRGKK